MKLVYLKILRFLRLIDPQKYRKKRNLALVKVSPLFNDFWYINQKPALDVSRRHAAKHYIKIGWRQGLNPSPFFDNNRYLNDNPEVKKNDICPLVYHLTKGKKQKKQYFPVSAHETLNQKKSILQNMLFYPADFYEEYKNLKRQLKNIRNLP